MNRIPKLKPLLTPAILALVAIICIFNLPLSEFWQKLSHYAFILFALAGFLLAYNYGWAKYSAGFLLLAAGYASVIYLVKLPIFSVSSENLILRPATGYALVSFLLPILFSFNVLFTNQGATLKNLSLRIVLITSFCLLFWLLTLAYPLPLANLLTTSYFNNLLLPKLGLAQIAQVSFIASWLLLAWFFWRKPSHFLAVNLINLPLLVLTLQFFYLPSLPVLSFLAGAILLLFSLLQEIFALAFIDDLTQIPARRALNKHLNSLGKKYSLAMADVDHFKKFNDTYGHDKGDEVLQKVAQLLNQVKGGGKAFRYGGEEFTLVFKGKTAEQALPYIEEVRQIIAQQKLNLGKKDQSVSVTMSFGLAENLEKFATPEAVVKAADLALYKAKKAGRNKTCLAD